MTGFFVFLGGGIGAFLRWLVATGIHNHWGTMLVNVAGAFLIGVLYGCLSSGAALKPEVLLFLMTGLLGGFTTFSTYLLDFAVLCEKDSFFEASLYLLLSVAAGLAVLYAGMKTGAFVCGG